MRQRVVRWSWVVVLALMGSAMAGRVVLASGEAKEVEAAMKEYARLLAAHDSAGLAASYAPDGELLEPGMDSLRGPQAIRKFLESFGEVRIESASMVPESTDVWGGVAMQWGTYAERVAEPGKAAADYRGRFVVQWVRQTGGRWLIRRLLTQPS